MICAGDEFGRTQKGNNNAWCQDNPISWLDWSLLETNKDFHRFYRQCIVLRKQHAIFRREKFFPPESDPPGTNLSPEIAWQYLTPDSQNWSPDCHGLAFLLRAAANDKSSSDFFVALNGSKDKHCISRLQNHYKKSGPGIESLIHRPTHRKILSPWWRPCRIWRKTALAFPLLVALSYNPIFSAFVR